MSGFVVSTVTNRFLSETLPPNYLWGVLEVVEPISQGLICAKVSGKESLADESLQEISQPLVGREWRICPSSFLSSSWACWKWSGIQNLDKLYPKELLESGKVLSGPFFKKILKDRDRVLDAIAAERAEKEQLLVAEDVL